MTISSSSSTITYQGNGSQTQFSFSFVAVAAADLTVFLTDSSGNITTLSSGYSVSLNSAQSGQSFGVGGTVTYPVSGSPLAAGNSITITRNLPFIQGTSLQNQGSMWPTSIEGALDYVTMLVQQLQQLSQRQLTVPLSDPVPGTVPAVAARANLLLGFDSSGNPTAVSGLPSGTVSSAMQPVVNAASISAAVSLLGLQALPVGLEADWPGLFAPTGWFIEDGSAQSRTTYANLFNVIAPVITCTVTPSSNIVTGIPSTINWAVGWAVEGTGIQAGTTIQSIDSNTQIHLSQPALSSVGVGIRIFPYGNGDGSTTFNLPDGRGYAYVGLDNPAGAGTTGRISVSAGNFDGTVLNNVGGFQTQTLTQTQLPNISVTFGGTAITSKFANLHDAAGTFIDTLTNSSSADGGLWQQAQDYNGTGTSHNIYRATTSATNGGVTIPAITPAGTITIGTRTGSLGAGGAHPNVQPTAIRNKIIYHG